LFAPPESHATSAVAPFGRASAARQYSSFLRAWSAREETAPDRTLFGRGVPAALGIAREGPGFFRTFDVYSLPAPPKDAPSELAADADVSGVASIAPPTGVAPRHYPTLRCTFVVEATPSDFAEARARIEATAGGATIVVDFGPPPPRTPGAEFQRAGYAAPTVDWATTNVGGAPWVFRSTNPGARLKRVVLKRDAALLDWAEGSPPARLDAANAEPSFGVVDRTGAPFVRVLWQLTWRRHQPPVVFVFRAKDAPAGDATEAGRAFVVGPEDLVQGPAGTTPPLALLRSLGDLWDKERRESGLTEFPFLLRAETAATPDGPPLSSTLDRVALFRP
jgi:hypothetical protein